MLRAASISAVLITFTHIPITMAEINNTRSGNHRKGSRSKSSTPRVDMTPMVDLGFLLITFFMLSTTLMQPKTMNLIMPREDGDPTGIRASRTLTILMDGGNRIAWYEGMPDHPEIQYSSYDQRNGIGHIIRRKRAEILRHTGANKLIVLIKASARANYRNVVDIMDEMLINDVAHYTLAEITTMEQQFFLSGRQVAATTIPVK